MAGVSESREMYDLAGRAGSTRRQAGQSQKWQYAEARSPLLNSGSSVHQQKRTCNTGETVKKVFGHSLI